MPLEITADYHTHTRYSHGKGTVAENVAAALARGLETVGITDHGHRSLPGVRMTPRGLAGMLQQVRAINARAPGVRVLAGVEANIVSLAGALDVPRQARDRLDLVLAGLHPLFVPPTWRDGWTLVGLNWLARWSPALRARTRTLNTKAVVEAVCRNRIDIITHPGWGLDIDTRELARACARRGTAMEINAGHGQMTVEYCIAAAREGVRFSLGSDAHSPEKVGALEPALEVAEQARLRPEQVLNARGGPGVRAEQRAALAANRADPPDDPGTAFTDWASQRPLSRETD